MVSNLHPHYNHNSHNNRTNVNTANDSRIAIPKPRPVASLYINQINVEVPLSKVWLHGSTYLIAKWLGANKIAISLPNSLPQITRQIWGVWKLRLAYSSETPNLGRNRWCFVPCDLEIWRMTLENDRASLLCCFKLCATFHSHWWIQTGVTIRKRPIWVKFDDF